MPNLIKKSWMVSKMHIIPNIQELLSLAIFQLFHSEFVTWNSSSRVPAGILNRILLTKVASFAYRNFQKLTRELFKY